MTTQALCERLAAALQQHDLMLATAESCTGGMIAAACTDLAGSSNWFERGFVTYSNEAKTELLGVEAALIARHGAIEATRERARMFAGRAIDALSLFPDGAARQAMTGAAEFAVARGY